MKSLKTFLHAYKIEIAIFLLALVVRCLYFGLGFEAAQGDLMMTIRGVDGYTAISENIIAGHGYSSDSVAPYTLNSVRPPIMPYFLAWGHQLPGGYTGVFVLYLVLGSLVPLLAMRVSRKIVDSRAVTLAVGFFIALDPFQVLFSTIFYAETVFTLLFLSGVLFLFNYFDRHRWYDLVVSACFLGFAALTKPTVQYLPLLIMGLLLWEFRKHFFTKEAVLRVGAYGLVFLAVISPWLFRNYVNFGVIGLSSQSTVNLYSTLVPSVLAVEHGTTFQKEFAVLIAKGADDPNSSNIKYANRYVADAMPILLGHPLSLAIVSANTALNFFIHDGMFDVLRHLKIRPDQSLGGPALFLLLKDPGAAAGFIVHYVQTPFFFVLVGRGFWVLFTVLFFAGAVRYYLRTPRMAGIAALCIVLYFMLTTLVVGLAVNARYRLPVNALIVTFAAYEVVALVAMVRPKST